MAAISTRERLILTAERLFAEYGIAGVSMRQIGTDAGQKNHSVVQYHFGSKEELVQEVFAYRMAAVNVRRQELLAQIEPGDCDELRKLVRVLVAPMAEQAANGAGHFLSFSARLHIDAEYETFAERGEDLTSGFLGVFARIRELLADQVPTELLAQRMWFVGQHHIFMFCQWERRVRQRGLSEMPALELIAENLVDYGTQALSAPVSDETRTALASAKRKPQRGRRSAGARQR